MKSPQGRDKQMGVMQESVLKMPICDMAEQNHISRVWDVIMEAVFVGMRLFGKGGDSALSRYAFDPLAVEAFSAEEKALREMVAMKCGMASGDAAEQFAGR